MSRRSLRSDRLRLLDPGESEFGQVAPERRRHGDDRGSLDVVRDGGETPGARDVDERVAEVPSGIRRVEVRQVPGEPDREVRPVARSEREELVIVRDGQRRRGRRLRVQDDGGRRPEVVRGEVEDERAGRESEPPSRRRGRRSELAVGLPDNRERDVRDQRRDQRVTSRIRRGEFEGLAYSRERRQVVPAT